MLDFDSEYIDDMDADEGDGQEPDDSEYIDDMDDDVGDEHEPTPIRHWTTTSSHDVYMVNTPKENDDEERKHASKGCPLEKQSKRQRKRRSKSRLGRSSNHKKGYENKSISKVS